MRSLSSPSVCLLFLQREGMRPLAMASAKGDAALVDLLLKYKAPVQATVSGKSKVMRGFAQVQGSCTSHRVSTQHQW